MTFVTFRLILQLLGHARLCHLCTHCTGHKYTVQTDIHCVCVSKLCIDSWSTLCSCQSYLGLGTRYCNLNVSTQQLLIN